MMTFLSGFVCGVLVVNFVLLLTFLNKRFCYYLTHAMAIRHAWSTYTITAHNQPTIHTIEVTRD
jgi:hypothetical protein